MSFEFESTVIAMITVVDEQEMTCPRNMIVKGKVRKTRALCIESCKEASTPPVLHMLPATQTPGPEAGLIKTLIDEVVAPAGATQVAQKAALAQTPIRCS